KKKQLGVYLSESHIKKIKTIAETNNISISALFECLLEDLLVDTMIDDGKVDDYDRRNKSKGNRRTKNQI
ncbi:MAG: hypothetical protein R3Y64_09945, partial [Peptostreptococcaceae bacterium]